MSKQIFVVDDEENIRTVIRAYLEKEGYAVLFVPETATELISGGVAPWTLESSVAYQRCQLKMQIEKEKLEKMYQ